MTESNTLLGPVYVAHRYWHEEEATRRENVLDARSLSDALNQAGIATISPLQESYGRESALTEEGWVAQGLSMLSVCVAMVYPIGQHVHSKGIRRELKLAGTLGIPIFVADFKGDGSWAFPSELRNSLLARRFLVQQTAAGNQFARELQEVATMLLSKNEAYGDSALDPVRIFSRATPDEGLRVRIDDKLSRLSRGHEHGSDDTLLDLIGYLIMLRISQQRGDT